MYKIFFPAVPFPALPVFLCIFGEIQTLFITAEAHFRVQ